MNEFVPSRRKLVQMTAAGILLFALPAIFADELPTAIRVLQAVLAVGCLVALVSVLRTRIVVTPNEIAIRRGFGAWFRAAPDAVKVTWIPIVGGLGRGHDWSVSVVLKGRKDQGVQVSLGLWHPATVDALRARLAEVTGSTNGSP